MSELLTREQKIEAALIWPSMLHPVRQFHLWADEEAYDWQIDALTEFAKPMSRVILSTENESGKTSLLLKVAGFAAMVAFPGCMVYSTSGSEDQVREQLFLTNLYPIVKELEPYGWNISIPDMTISAPNGSRWKGYKCVRGGKAEGFHGKYGKFRGSYIYRPCIYLIDEGKTVEDTIFEAVQRIDPDFLMAVSTPGPEAGWFYRGIDPDDLEEVKPDVVSTDEMTEDDIRAEIAELKALESKL